MLNLIIGGTWGPGRRPFPPKILLVSLWRVRAPFRKLFAGFILKTS